MLTPEDYNKIEELVKKHKGTASAGFITLLFILFLNGCFKGCGY